MLRGIGKVTAQIATDGKYLLHVEQEGVGSGKAVALPRAGLQKSGTCGVTPPPSPGTACRDVSHQEHGAFPRLLDPSPWLAGPLQPVPAFCGRGQWPHTPSPGAASRAGAQTANAWRSNEWQQELSLSQEEHIPNAARNVP